MTVGDKARLSKALCVRNLYISVPHLYHGRLMEARTVIKHARVGNWPCCNPPTFYVMHKTGILFARDLTVRAARLLNFTLRFHFLFCIYFIFYE